MKSSKFLFPCVIAILIIIAFMILQSKQNLSANVITSTLSPEIASIKNTTGAGSPKILENIKINIDSSEDISTLGFSPQRKIVQDSQENFYVAYRKKYQGYYQIFVTKLSKANNYQASDTNKPIALIANNSQRVPSIAIDSKNSLHIVWYGSDTKNEDERQIKYASSADGGLSWSQWINISPVEGFSGGDYWQEHPYIFAGQNDNLYVVWEGKDNQNKYQQIKFSKSVDDGKTWSKWQNVRSTPEGTQSRPIILQDLTGKLHILMYSSFGERIQQIRYTFSEDGQSWNNWQTISNLLDDSRHLSASIGANDVIHLVWRSGILLGPTQIFYARLKNNQWSKPEAVSSSGNYQFFPSIALNLKNEIYVAWMETSDSADYPKEQPEKGKVYLSWQKSGKFQPAALVTPDDLSLYPSLPMNILDNDNIPLVFSQINDRESFKELIFKLIYPNK